MNIHGTKPVCPKKFYCRQEDQAKLVHAYQRRNERQFILLVGQAGNGKTTLAETLRSHVEGDNDDAEGHQNRLGYFLTGRFDPLEAPEPYASFVQMGTQFIHRATQGSTAVSTTAGTTSEGNRIKTALSKAR